MQSVLLVEDDRLIRQMLFDMLADAGFAVFEAENGIEGIARAEETEPAAILLDLHMPVLDGIETCRRLRARPRFRHTAILLITGCKEMEGRVNPFELGADDYLAKPVTPRDLVLRIRAAVARKQAAAAAERQTRAYEVVRRETAQLRETTRRLEQELRLRETYEQIFENASEGLVAFNRQGRVLFANRKSLEITGYPREELSGLRLSALLDFRSLRRLLRIVRSREESLAPRFDVVLKTRTGDRRQLSVSVNDRPVGDDLYVIAFRDVTAKRQMEGELAATRTSLEKANERLCRIDQARAEFLNTAAHELRIPVTVLNGYLSLLQEMGTENLTEEQREFLAVALDNSDRMVDLTNNMLDLSRLEAGKMAMEIGRFDLGSTVHEVCRDFRPLAARGGLSLEVMSAVSCQALFDEDQIRRVLANLLTNAIKFTPAGGRVEVRLAHSETEAQVRVEDTGQGIPPERIAELFEEFVQLSQHDARRGTGLGLAICKRIIDSHQGRIWVESTPGVGSRFSFTLPRPV